MKVGSLFSGIGGFDEAFRRCGAEIVFASEIDKNARAIYRKQFPNVDLLGDITKLKDLPAVDILCGGFPCQDLSIAGKRRGLKGERSGLFYEIIRLVREIQPEVIFLENVPGLLNSNRGRDFGVVLGELGKCGYNIAWRVFNSQYFGVPQRRRRVFIIASLGKFSCGEILFESKSLCGNFTPCEKKGKEIVAPVTTRVGGSGSGWPRYDEDKHLIANTLTAGSETKQCPERGVDTYVFDWQSGGDVRLNISDKHTSALQASQTPAIWEMDRRGENAIREHDICPTITQHYGTGGNNVPFVGVRRLTPLECERLQSFPDNWTRSGIDESGVEIEISDSARYRCLGNAVTVNVIEWIAKRMRGMI